MEESTIVVRLGPQQPKLPRIAVHSRLRELAGRGRSDSSNRASPQTLNQQPHASRGAVSHSLPVPLHLLITMSTDLLAVDRSSSCYTSCPPHLHRHFPISWFTQSLLPVWLWYELSQRGTCRWIAKRPAVPAGSLPGPEAGVPLLQKLKWGFLKTERCYWWF